MTEEERAEVQRLLASPRQKPPSIAKGLTICCIGIGAVLGTPFLAHIVSKNTGLPLLIFLGGIGATVVGAWLIVVHVTQAPTQRQRDQESARRLEAALARGTMLVIEMESDAAWTDLGPNDDSDALLFRVGPGRFVYVNDDWLNDLPIFDKSEGKRFPARVTLRMLDESIESRAGLSVHDGGGEIEVRNDIVALPDYDKGGYPEILTEDEHFGTPFLELTDADMPASWLPVLRRP